MAIKQEWTTIWIKRGFESVFSQNQSQPVAVVVGPRQSGKSSVLEHLSSPTRREISLDDLNLREQAQRDPKLFLDSLGDCLLIDEAQYAPALFPELKLRVDALKKSRRNGEPAVPLSYWLTGSNRILLDTQVSESLAGRASYFRFYPLSARELAQHAGTVSLAQLLERASIASTRVHRQSHSNDARKRSHSLSGY